MPAPEVSICSTALVLIGDKPITTLQGSGAPQVACSNVYEPVVKDLLGRYRWRFASRMVQLERVDLVPLSVFESAYQLPAECEMVYAVKVGNENILFDRFENHIYCDAAVEDVVIAEVMVVPGESYWPPYFRTLVEYELAAALAIPITEDTQKAAYFTSKALRQFSLAKTLDSQARTARRISMGGLRRYHGGGP